MPEDIAETNQKQLANTLWSIADPQRGAKEADDIRHQTAPQFFATKAPTL